MLFYFDSCLIPVCRSQPMQSSSCDCAAPCGCNSARLLYSLCRVCRTLQHMSIGDSFRNFYYIRCHPCRLSQIDGERSHCANHLAGQRVLGASSDSKYPWCCWHLLSGAYLCCSAWRCIYLANVFTFRYVSIFSICFDCTKFS